MKAGDLVGTWFLEIYETRSADGKVVRPMGDVPFGRLTYTPGGYMHVLMAPAGRAPFASNNLYGDNDAERLAAANRFVAYCGSYEVVGNTVIHHAEGSFFPNWIGQALRRQATLEADRLTLTSPSANRGGVQGTAYIVWRRSPH
ncbi:MAG: lipocalin-like domain-containing protein [Alphaproteobacteria bacterium]|nr:lipocalin-like domain-containing protein [Alphaproteobacteria bacterium]